MQAMQIHSSQAPHVVGMLFASFHFSKTNSMAPISQYHCMMKGRIISLGMRGGVA